MHFPTVPNITIFDPPAVRPLVKRYRIDPSTGELQSGKAPNLPEGRGYCIAAPTPAALSSILDAATNQALCLGQPPHPTTNGYPYFLLTNSKNPNPPPGSIIRTKETFHFTDGPGWMLVDFDELPFTHPDPIANAYAALCYLWPETAHASLIIRQSSSSGLYRCDKTPPQHFPKMHAFILIDDQRKAQTYLQELVRRATSIGFPNMIDAKVASPERLIFIAPPRLCPYTYRRTVPTYYSDERPAIALSITNPNANTHNANSSDQNTYYDPYDIQAAYTRYNRYAETIPPDLRNPANWPAELAAEIDNYIAKLIEHLASDIFHAPEGTRANTLFQCGAKLGNLMWTNSPALAASGQHLLQAAQDAGYNDDHVWSKARHHLSNGWNHGTQRPFTDIPPLVRWPNRHAILASGIAIMEMMKASQ